MRKLLIFVSAGLLQAGCSSFIGDCNADLEVLIIPSGSYGSMPDANYGLAKHALPHAGAIDRMEVDRKAGLIRFHGRMENGQAFIETFRIAEEIVD